VAAVQVLVYAGAILVLFLFVVMLLNVQSEERGKRFQSSWPLTVPLGMTLCGLFVGILVWSSQFNGVQGQYTVQAVKEMGSSQAVGKVLYTDFLFPFEVASVILLVAMVGAIVLAKKKLD